MFFNGFHCFFIGFLCFSWVSSDVSLDLLVFITRVLGFVLATLGSHLVLDWFYSGFGQVVLLWPTQERVAGAAQKCSRRSGAPKSVKMIAFQSFLYGFLGGGDRREH